MITVDMDKAMADVADMNKESRQAICEVINVIIRRPWFVACITPDAIKDVARFVLIGMATVAEAMERRK